MKVYANKNPETVYKKVLDLDVKGKKILIKPNLLNDMPANKGVTTDLQQVKKLIKYLKNKGAKVIVGELPIEDSNVLKKLRVKNLPCKVINFKDDEWINVKSKTQLCLKELKLPRTAIESDYIISYAKLKTHALTGVTLSIKNLFGLINKADRKKAHIKGLNESIIDILSCFKKGKVIGLVDAKIGLDGRGGPINGVPRKIGLVIGSKDLVSCDAACTKLMGANPKKITHLKMSQEHGLGEIEHEVIGVKLNDYKQKFTMPPATILYFGTKILQRYLKKKPYLKNPGNCTKCLSCMKNCPVKAIKYENEIKFDYKECIGCMVCLESCKQNALDYKQGLLMKVIKTFLNKNK